MSQRYPPKAWLLLLALSLIWGSSFILIKKGLTQLSPLEVGSLRMLSASIFLIPIGIKRLKTFPRNKIGPALSVGFLGSFLPAFLYAIAQTEIESSVTGVLNTVTPVFTLLVGVIAFGQKKPLSTFLGVLLGLSGSTLLIMAGSDGSFSINYYALIIVLATIFYAINSNLIKHYLQGQKAMSVTSISLGAVGPLALIVLLGFTDFTDKVLSSHESMLATFYVVLLGVIGTAFAMLLFNKLVGMTDAVFSASVTYIIPIVAVLWGILDGEQLLAVHFIGITIILVGVYIINMSKGKIG